MKRLVVLSLALLLISPSVVRAQASDPLEGKVTKKTKRPPLEGFGLRFGIRGMTGVNTDYEGGYLSLSYQFKPVWHFGKLISPKGWLRNLRLELRLNVSHQPVGYSAMYIDGNVDPRYRFATADELSKLVNDRGGFVYSRRGQMVYTVNTRGNRVARLSDLMLSLVHGNLYTIPKAKIAIDGLVRLMLPTSVQSQNASLYLAITAALGVSRSFSWKIGKVKQALTIGYMFGATRYFHKYKTLVIDRSYAGGDANLPVLGDSGETIPNDLVWEGYQAPVRNPVAALSNDFFVYYNFYKGMMLMVGYGLTHSFLYDLKDCTIEVNGVSENICENNDEIQNSLAPRGERYFQNFSVGLMYQPLPYLQLQFLMYTQTPQRKPNSTTIQQPFFVANANNYTAFMLSAYVTLERLYSSLTGKKKSNKAVAMTLPETRR